MHCWPAVCLLAPPAHLATPSPVPSLRARQLSCHAGPSRFAVPAPSPPCTYLLLHLPCKLTHCCLWGLLHTMAGCARALPSCPLATAACFLATTLEAGWLGRSKHCHAGRHAALLRRAAAPSSGGCLHRLSGVAPQVWRHPTRCLITSRWRRAWSIRPKASWAIFRESSASMRPASKCIPAARCGMDCEKLRKRTGRGAASPPLAGGIGGGRRPTALRLLDPSPSLLVCGTGASWRAGAAGGSFRG